ncbi:AraC family transcriptional regulator [Pseudomonas sp. CBSPBW29]|uniref:AraC family transcriptional regulator n=1 Tax=Pseudomonas TaxID=286 RepID=UPI0021AD3AD6|nr:MULTISPECIES: AraC family transcriptional regulator [unclassified Pseudomonas]WEL44173.1 AraC family transcriptional regulator [Pseudomonas sp. CBSPBW29]WEL65253.1 AraC family transcriptional regulator [Pseudomonas sp. CBSPGW29]WEL68724.1 AraC family transcriptional regulator [Pseudomonas sp. CBSPCGW29]WEL75732.1 AraC family transcriptional regulator [Pseudomonas sp. CBSPAW29]WEL88555.1 AraC family transcriptional regulator [Pseudomonas sp. CBSPCBW29]
MNTQLIELRALAAKAENRRTETGIPRVAMVQGAIPEHMLAAVYDPMINLILQGSKSMTVGDRTLRYDPATYFVMSIELPAVGTVHPAATGEPYLAVSLTLDPTVLATLLSDLPKPAVRYDHDAGFSVAAVTPELMDAWLRMLRLMGNPEAIAALAPVYEREILYRVLQGPHGWMLREIAAPDTAMARVSQAIQWIRRDFAEPIRVEALAQKAAMSVSAFHRHFKAVTNLSPLQYQKRVRLLQARTLMVASAKNVTSAAFEVGYESATQFSRDYARVFGLPPARDAARILGENRGPKAN